MSNPNLPPLPTEVESVYVSVDGLSTFREARDCYYTMDQMHSYAEQAVRQALAAQEPVRWLHTLYSEKKDPLQEKVTLSQRNPFGVPGTDYKPTHSVMSEPLYGAPCSTNAVEALQRIASIEDKMFGGDWDEIEEAREIARDALAAIGLPKDPPC